MNTGSQASKSLLSSIVLVLLLSFAAQAAFSSVRPLSDSDIAYLTSEQLRQGVAGDGVSWAVRAGYFGRWQPLAWMSHMLDYQLFGGELLLHRATSLILHSVNAVLIFLCLVKATGRRRRSLWAALLFGAHPLQLEALTAPAARGVVLGTLFVLAALMLYASAASRPKPLKYCGIMLLFFMAVLACPALCVFPLLLLLLDLWPLRRLKYRGLSAQPSSTRGWTGVRGLSVRALVAEKIPLFVLSASLAVFSVLAAWSWQSDPSLLSVGWLHRLFDSFGWMWIYAARSLWPFTISTFFLPQEAALPLWLGAAALLLLVWVSTIVWRAMWRFPYLFAAWFWFLLTLFPHLPLVQWGVPVGSDSALYLSFAGAITAAVWSVADLAARFERRRGKQSGTLVRGG